MGGLRCDRNTSGLTNALTVQSYGYYSCSDQGLRRLSFGLLITIVEFGTFKIPPNYHGNSMVRSYLAIRLKTALFDKAYLVNASKIQSN